MVKPSVSSVLLMTLYVSLYVHCICVLTERRWNKEKKKKEFIQLHVCLASY
jgi:hypothetical protein